MTFMLIFLANSLFDLHFQLIISIDEIRSLARIHKIRYFSKRQPISFG